MTEVRFLPKTKMNSIGYEQLLEPFRFSDKLSSKSLTALKIHPGEEGNSSYIPASLIKEIITALKLPESSCFLTDTTVLYGGRRMTAPDYMNLAYDHGFRIPELPPFIVADGLTGTDEYHVKLPDTCQTDTARLASILAQTDNAVVISHFKGHLLAGFGGAIKHLGMGWASKAGKLYQHSSVVPFINKKYCTLCEVCLAVCGVSAIEKKTSSIEINSDICTGCGECIGRCPSGAIKINWNQESATFTRRMAEYALAATIATDIPVYVNFLINISPDCDCMKNEGSYMVEDIGVLASCDPVALDQASLDLVTKAQPIGDNAAVGQDKFKKIRPDRDGNKQLEIAEELGIGSRKYQLITI